MLVLGLLVGSLVGTLPGYQYSSSKDLHHKKPIAEHSILTIIRVLSCSNPSFCRTDPGLILQVASSETPDRRLFSSVLLILILVLVLGLGPCFAATLSRVLGLNI